jgi:beta-phosphoglucomutase-like phosphatase (HAD superfamily)
MSKKLVLFDLDGVLLDSKENMNISWMVLCEKFNLNVEFADCFSHIGRPFQNILEILNIKEDKYEIELAFNKVSSKLINKVNIYNGDEVVLHQLFNKNIKTGIITSKETKKTRKILALLDFTFDIIQTPNDDLNGKPAPIFYLR